MTRTKESDELVSKALDEIYYYKINIIVIINAFYLYLSSYVMSSVISSLIAYYILDTDEQMVITLLFYSFVGMATVLKIISAVRSKYEELVERLINCLAIFVRNYILYCLLDDPLLFVIANSIIYLAIIYIIQYYIKSQIIISEQELNNIVIKHFIKYIYTIEYASIEVQIMDDNHFTYSESKTIDYSTLNSYLKKAFKTMYTDKSIRYYKSIDKPNNYMFDKTKMIGYLKSII
jgi:hypothetical protein